MMTIITFHLNRKIANQCLFNDNVGVVNSVPAYKKSLHGIVSDAINYHYV